MAPKPRETPSQERPLERQPGCLEPFRVEPHDFRFDPGVNLNKLNQLVDELESSEAVNRLT
jgi:hypothetical protein